MVAGGGFQSGTQEDPAPSNSYFASRGFVSFGVQYRVAKDKGLYPAELKHYNPKQTYPHSQWTPYIWAMYPAVRDVKAALRWIHAHADEYNADTSSITLQGGSAGATAALELALTAGDDTFAGDYTDELKGKDRTLSSANIDQKATAHGLIDYWGGLFSEDAMVYADVGLEAYGVNGSRLVALIGYTYMYLVVCGFQLTTAKSLEAVFETNQGSSDQPHQHKQCIKQLTKLAMQIKCQKLKSYYLKLC